MVKLEKCESFPLGSGRHHFFPRISFNATSSNIASASNRFNWRSHLQAPQPLGLRHIQATKFSFPLVNAGIADTVLAAQLRNSNTRLVFLQYYDNLLFRKSVPFHISGRHLLGQS
jgi:hypothetical protein